MNPLFLVYCPTVRHLQGLSWPRPDCFVFVCLSLGPERQEWDSKKKKKQKGKKAIPFPGLIIEALGSDMSWLKQHHFCHSCLATDLTNDAVGSPPDAIKYGVKQEGLPSALLFQPLLVPTPWPRCFFLKSKVQWHFSIFFFLSLVVLVCLYTLGLFLSSLRMFYCLLWGLVWGTGLELP